MPPKKKVSADQDDEPSGAGSQVKVRHILCEKKAKIDEAIEKLRAAYKPETGKPAAGWAKWNEVCAQYAEDKAATGGNLGWMARGSMAGPFQEAAFKLPLSGKTLIFTDPPIKTQHGYHIIVVEDRK
eukprot:m.68196 g.68196  ORF g.68196 m.68196 type:complete len:127 (+) comp50006_c0_seq1:80-460(+)